MMASVGSEFQLGLCIGVLLGLVAILFAKIFCQRRDHLNMSKLLENIRVANKNLSDENEDLKLKLQVALDNCSEVRTQFNLSLDNCEDLRGRLNQAVENGTDIRQKLSQAVSTSTRLRNQRNARTTDLVEVQKNLGSKEVALQAASDKIKDLENKNEELKEKLAMAPEPELPMMEFTDADKEVLANWIDENRHLGGFKRLATLFMDSDEYKGILDIHGYSPNPDECDFRAPTKVAIEQRIKRSPEYQ